MKKPVQLVFTFLFSLTVSALFAASAPITGSAQIAAAKTSSPVRVTRRETPKFGRIEVVTNPGTYALLVDAQPAGTTGPAVRFLDLDPGHHTVEIVFPNGRRWTREFNVVAGRRQCVELNFKPQEPCVLTISAPSNISEGDVVTFAADVTNNGKLPLNYSWRVSPESARILSGQGTPTITVDSTGLGSQRVTAILNIDDRATDPLCACKQEAQGNTIVSAPSAPPLITPRRFDEFPSLSFDDDKARLDNLAIELQNSPGAVAHVLVYGNKANRLGARAQSYLVATRGIDASRVRVVNGGLSDVNYIELWLVPRGAKPPQPTKR
ncbi:MAG: hypothetical protein WKF84_30750 [Pyrinomonadaceae bacterium]